MNRAIQECAPLYMCATPYESIPSAHKVININQVSYFLYVQIPVELKDRLALFEVAEIGVDPIRECPRCIWNHEKGRIWYQFKSGLLNTVVGHHLYRMSFVDTLTDEIVLLYFSYTIQDDSPKKPYQYMKPGCSCGD